MVTEQHLLISAVTHADFPISRYGLFSITDKVRASSFVATLFLYS